MLPPTLQIRHASFAYRQTLIFSKLNFELPSGKWVGLLGPSGVGKTTLLKTIAGLHFPAEDPLVTQITADNGLPVAEQIAYMAQSDLLLPWATVLENALLSMKLGRFSRAERRDKFNLAKSLLSKVGLAPVLSHYPHHLSGGMRQRVALVRTLLTEKPIILMDEPFSSLDAITRYKLQEIAAEILQNKTVFFITHDPLEALRLANIIYVMKGQPATLKAISTILSPPPRDIMHPEITALQAPLYHELMLAAEENA